MLIKNARKNGEDWEFDLDLKADEVDFLVNFATQVLLSEGMLSIKEQDALQEVELPREQNAPSTDTVN